MFPCIYVWYNFGTCVNICETRVDIFVVYFFMKNEHFKCFFMVFVSPKESKGQIYRSKLIFSKVDICY